MWGRRALSGLAGVVAIAALGGCASGPFALEVRHAGKLDPEKDERVAEEAQALPWDGDYEDIVVTNELPPGVTLEKGALAARSDLFTILGDVRSHMDDTRQAAFAKSVFWYESMHESHGSGRDVFCKVQTPLRTLTLGIFALVSPTSWPCYVLYTKKLSTNAAIHRGELRRAARAMGGNLVILTGINAEQQSYVTGYGYHSGTGSESVPGASAHAWILVDKSRGKGAAAPAAPSAPPAPAEAPAAPPAP